jgi:predicted DsbA family dithiol-disulfide isomerase
MIQAAPAQAEAITLDMFALQDSGVVFFEISKIEDVAKKYGISGIATCVNADSAVEERVFHHVAFARSVPLTEAPAVVVAAVRRGKVSERVSAISGAKDPAMIEDMIEEARLRARSAQ